MNKLTKTILWGLLFIILHIISYQYDVYDERHLFNLHGGILIAGLLFRYISFITLFMYFFHLGMELRDVINIKYRIIKDPNFTYIYEAHYFTLGAFCIPTWKPISTELESYKVQNLFGAKFDRCYESENYFKSEADAVKAIEEHKEVCRKNRKEWITSNRKPKKSIKYL